MLLDQLLQRQSGRDFRLANDPHHLRDRGSGQLSLLQERSLFGRRRVVQDEADNDRPDAADDVALEGAIRAERDQSVGDDLAGRPGDLDARLLLSG